MQPKEVEARTSYDPALLKTLAPGIPATLTERRKWRKDARNVCEGDLVLVVDENSPRGCWPLGRVLIALPGDDWRIRAAEVRTKTGTYIRPVVKLCLLQNAK